MSTSSAGIVVWEGCSKGMSILQFYRSGLLICFSLSFETFNSLVQGFLQAFCSRKDSPRLLIGRGWACYGRILSLIDDHYPPLKSISLEVAMWRMQLPYNNHDDLEVNWCTSLD